MPRPTEPVKRVCYADDLTVWATGVKIPDLEDSINSYLLLLFAMIRSVVKSFKVPGVEVVASRMSNGAALTRMIDSTPKKTWSYLTLVLDG